MTQPTLKRKRGLKLPQQEQTDPRWVGHPDWGGKRAGAGAPRFNLNRLLHGHQSKLLKKGIERMAADPEMRAVLLIIARLALHGEVPPQTKHAIQVAMRKATGMGNETLLARYASAVKRKAETNG